MGLEEGVVRRGAALDALGDHRASTVTAVGDRDVSSRAESFRDQPIRESHAGTVAQDDVVSLLLFEDADHDP